MSRVVVSERAVLGQAEKEVERFRDEGEAGMRRQGRKVEEKESVDAGNPKPMHSERIKKGI